MRLDDYEAMAARLQAAQAGMCGDVSPPVLHRRSFVCTRPHGHPGAHQARSSTGHLFADWEYTRPTAASGDAA